MFTVCGIKNRRCCLLVARMRWYTVSPFPPHPGHQQAAPSVLYTTNCKHSLALPEDGRNYRPKHVELIEIVIKLLLLHLVGCLYYCAHYY